MGQSSTPKALAWGVSLSLACGLLPGAAFAEEALADDTASNAADAAPSGEAAKPTGYDKADFYSDNASARFARAFAAPLSLSLNPVLLSDEMKYFAKYESNQNYNQGLSWGDGYHAMGYYQLDNRYSLKSFIVACYNYDPVKYSMFGWVTGTDISGDLYDRSAGKLTAVGQQLNDSWHAAYNADPTEFSALQDSYVYANYYIDAEKYLAGRGIDISNRSDCVKGLCWGLANLFGTSGWHKFVGGWSDGYVNGTYYDSYNYPGAGLTNDMTDEEFVSTLCDYVVAHVGEFYQGQPQYHQGWQNRYVQEKATCLAYIASRPTVTPPDTTTPPETVIPPEETPKPEDPETTPPTGDPEDPKDETENPEGNPQEPETTPPTDNPTADPEKPGDTTPPAGNGGLDGSGNQGGANEAPAPNEPTDTDSAPDGDPSGDKTEQPKQEVVDKNTDNLEEPAATATQPENQQAKLLDTGTSDETQNGTSKTSSLTQTGDDAAKGPLGVALVSVGAAAIAGAALATRRIIK